MADPPKQTGTAPAAAAAGTKAAHMEGNPALRMMGLPRLRARLPSRNWMIFLTVTGSFTAAYFVDRYHKKNAQQKWCNAVSHLSTEPFPVTALPRKLTVYLSAPPGDGLQPAREYFAEYVKPILVAAAADWQVVEGRKEGDLRTKIAEKIRKERLAKERPSEEDEENPDMVKAIRERFGATEEDTRGGDIVIGRHTWKEYVRGLHEGWLGPLDPPAEPQPELFPGDLPSTTASTELLGTTESAPKTVFDSTSSEPKGDLLNPPESEGAEVDSEPISDSPVKPSEEPASKPEEEPKEKAKATTHKPPYILPAAYSAATLAPSTPDPFQPSTALLFPHILGFFNTPTRIYRFLTKRRLADEAGHQVATLLLSPAARPFEQYSQPSSSSSPDATTLASPPSDATSSPSPSLSPTVSQSQSPSWQWEQQLLLLQEEADWHKSARQPNPDTGADQFKERPWSEPMAIDARIGARMRTPVAISDPASPSRPPATDDSMTSATATSQGDDGSAVRGNSREWKGGAERPSRQTWAVWAKEMVGLEESEESKKKCKGWEQGLVGDEDA